MLDWPACLMSDSPDTPVAIDRVDRARGSGDGVRLRLSGRRLESGHGPEPEPLLVIQLQGRRHRFPADREDVVEPLAPGGGRRRSPSHPGPNPGVPARLRCGWATRSCRCHCPVKFARRRCPGHCGPGCCGPGCRRAGCRCRCRGAPTADAPSEPLPAPEAGEPVFDTGRTGPLAELLFKENVTALHAELEQRSAEAARLRGALADAQSQLTARATTQAALEVAQAELRGELQQLMAAATGQREDFTRRLGEAEDERDRLREQLEVERRRAQGELESERERARASWRPSAAAGTPSSRPNGPRARSSSPSSPPIEIATRRRRPVCRPSSPSCRPPVAAMTRSWARCASSWPGRRSPVTRRPER